MKKIIFLAIVFLLIQLAYCFAETKYITELPRVKKDEIMITNFNAYNFGKSKSDAELDFMAKMLRNTSILLIEEVSTDKNFGTQAAGRLMDSLKRTGAKWDYYISDKTTGDGSEKYVTAWNTSKVTFLKPLSGLTVDVESELDREPLKSVFKIKDKKLEIFSFHLVPTAKNPEREVEIVVSKPTIFSGGNIILAGDFNLSYKKLTPFEEKLGFRHLIEGKTSIKDQVGPKGEKFANEYDNILIKSTNFEVTSTGILDFTGYFPDLKQAKQISDHLPVYFVLKEK